MVSLITNPIWVVKTRLALQHGGGAGAGGAGVKIPSAAAAPYKGFFDAMIRIAGTEGLPGLYKGCLLYTSPSPRDKRQSRMPSSA